MKRNKAAFEKVIGEVFETHDYAYFKVLEGNRETSQGHIKALMKSMQEVYIVSPVIINKDNCIIDGQHRFEAAKALGLPIRYIVDEKADLRSVQLLNAKSKDWTPTHYMESYIKMGHEEYIEYKKYLTKYKFTHQICQVLLGGVESKAQAEKFKNGDFKITTYKKAERVGEFMLKSMEFYKGSRRRSYIFAISLLIKKGVFVDSVFLGRLEAQRSKMYDCASALQYVELIEHIYNYRSRKKVSLKY